MKSGVWTIIFCLGLGHETMVCTACLCIFITRIFTSKQQIYLHVQYIPRNMHTVFALLCFVVVIHWLIFPYPSGLLHWHCGNLTIAPVPAKQPWWIWINTSCEFIMNDCITTTKQSTTKPCAYFLGYTVSNKVDDFVYTWYQARCSVQGSMDSGSQSFSWYILLCVPWLTKSHDNTKNLQWMNAFTIYIYYIYMIFWIVMRCPHTFIIQSKIDISRRNNDITKPLPCSTIDSWWSGSRQQLAHPGDIKWPLKECYFLFPEDRNVSLLHSYMRHTQIQGI